MNLNHTNTTIAVNSCIFFILCFFTFCLTTTKLFAQGVGINSDGTAPGAGVMLDIKGTTDDNSTFGLQVKNNSGTAIMAIRNDSRVGIGTTDPAKALDVSVNGTASPATGGLLGIGIVNADLTVNALSGVLFRSFDDGGTARHGGAIVAGKTSNWVGGSGNYPGFISFWTRPFSGNQAEHMRITDVGNVGIGNPAPAYKLDVTGIAHVDGLNVNGAYDLPTTDGAANRVLKTDGSGNITWSADEDSGGDITGITSGDGLTGGGSSGSPTINVVARNGLTDNANDIELGGTLDENTTITQSNFNMIYDLNGSGDFQLRDAGTVAFSVNDDGITYIGASNTAGNDLYIADRLTDWDNTSYYVDPNGTSRVNEVHGDGGSQTDPAFTFGGDANTGIFRPGADQLSITTGGTEKLRILADGNIGIGITNPAYKLHINGKVKTTGITEISDIRFKKDIKPLEHALLKIKQIEGVSYNWRTKKFPEQNFEKDRQIGVIAQEIEKIIPEVVETDPNGFKSVEYSHLVPYLIEAIKELTTYAEESRAYIHSLNTQNALLQEQINSLNLSSQKASTTPNTFVETK